jgi:hypothetical protein
MNNLCIKCNKEIPYSENTKRKKCEMCKLEDKRDYNRARFRNVYYPKNKKKIIASHNNQIKQLRIIKKKYITLIKSGIIVDNEVYIKN